ncbi:MULTISPECIES: MFS transporter [Nocardiaceae]|uniref:EmrB/QacA subfamily drug resistance transporter n=1 Tax=Rhodococcoides corynebacterioides TaxID=53972 RepID=A0ABS2KVZ7_9NOCA|nr:MULTISPECIES: MFS transporter [Rhodococcus]MBM7416125.1 EmrB/QacA subfamily drug resistance transporter [Rhodococcus corynebacterioides]MBP1114378.1 EmrB/QacA subfamily drug resistance transporter [Rhodococcus sp. PvP016]
MGSSSKDDTGTSASRGHSTFGIRTEIGRRRQLAAFGVICIAELLIVLDMTIINVALPSIGIELSTGISGLQWVVDAYTLTFSGLLLAFGNLGDRYGRKLFLVVGLTGLGTASVIGALGDSLVHVLTSRSIMGVFAAMVLPATLAVITNLFPKPQERALAIGVWSSIAGVAVAIGPVSGGWLLEHFSWHSVFWMNVPVALVAVVLVVLVVPESKASAVGPLDVPGVILSIAGVTLLVFVVIEAPNFGWTSWRTIGGLVLAAAFLVLFVRRERRISSPVLDVSLFRIRPFAWPAVSIAVGFFSLFGFLFLITQYFQGVREYSPLAFGIATLPFAAALAVSSPVSTIVAQKIGTMPVLVTGLVLIGAGLLVAGRVEIDSSYLTLVLPAMLLLAVGIAIIQGPATESIMSSLPLDEAGAGAAVNDTTREIGGTLGVAVLGSIVASYYVSTVRPLVERIPTAIMSETEKGYAQSSVLSVIEIQKRDLPAMFEPQRAQLILEMKEAALRGSSIAAYVAAGAVFVCAALVFFFFPASYRTTGMLAPQTSDERAVDRLAAAKDAGSAPSSGPDSPS